MPTATYMEVTQKPSDPKLMSKETMVKKMLADQKIIREAIQNGISFTELKEKHGFKFATV